MACNVFGTPVTDETLKGMPEYHDKELTQIDRARVALELKNAEGKDANAHKYADYIKEQVGVGRVMTLGLIYNATGGPLTYFGSRDWKGHRCQSPYPFIIANGQWGVFGHASSNGDHSKGVVVYHGKVASKGLHCWALSWANNTDQYSYVHGRVDGQGWYCDGEKDWDLIQQNLDNSRRLMHKDHTSGSAILCSIGDDKISFVEAIMTLSDALPESE